VQATCSKLASFNVESLFERAQALDEQNWATGAPALEQHAEVNKLLGEPVYTDAIKTKIVDLLVKLGLDKSDEDRGYARLRVNRGHLLETSCCWRASDRRARRPQRHARLRAPRAAHQRHRPGRYHDARQVQQRRTPRYLRERHQGGQDRLHPLSPHLFGLVQGGTIFRKGAWGGKNGDMWPHYPTMTSAVQAASDHAALYAKIHF
jgi:hypothetical protein